MLSWSISLSYSKPRAIYSRISTKDQEILQRFGHNQAFDKVKDWFDSVSGPSSVLDTNE